MKLSTKPDRTISQDSLAGQVAAFGRLLKSHGMTISIPSVMDALRGISAVGVARMDDFRTVLQACLMTRLEDFPMFQRLFVEFWLERFQGETQGPGTPSSGDEEHNPPGGAAAGDDLVMAEAVISQSQEQEAWQGKPFVVYSAREVLRDQDFRDVPEAQDEGISDLIREIIAPVIRRLSTRCRPSQAGVGIDFRRLLRRNVRYGGEILELPRVRRRLRIKRLVFLCDVSGSMNPYLRFMLRFIKEVQQLPTTVETFVFATRLSRITPMLTHLPFARALEEIGKTVRDWHGGTRIGSCLEQFIAFRGGAMVRSSTVIVIFSDGWDRGEPLALERAMARISLKSYRIIWINPLLGGPSYEPTCRGMKAALPYVDSFLPGHNLASLERLAGTLRGLLT